MEKNPIKKRILASITTPSSVPYASSTNGTGISQPFALPMATPGVVPLPYPLDVPVCNTPVTSMTASMPTTTTTSVLTPVLVQELPGCLADSTATPSSHIRTFDGRASIPTQDSSFPTEVSSCHWTTTSSSTSSARQNTLTIPPDLTDNCFTNVVGQIPPDVLAVLNAMDQIISEQWQRHWPLIRGCIINGNHSNNLKWSSTDLKERHRRISSMICCEYMRADLRRILRDFVFYTKLSRNDAQFLVDKPQALWRAFSPHISNAMVTAIKTYFVTVIGMCFRNDTWATFIESHVREYCESVNSYNIIGQFSANQNLYILCARACTLILSIPALQDEQFQKSQCFAILQREAYFNILNGIMFNVILSLLRGQSGSYRLYEGMRLVRRSVIKSDLLGLFNSVMKWFHVDGERKPKLKALFETFLCDTLRDQQQQ